MAIIALAGLFVLLACTSGQQHNYVDYDYQSQAQALSRPSTGLSRAAAIKPTPVPIIKQINRHNDDGSYTYGYEGADGSFKIETKLPTGEVSGKYGYVDDTGKLRVVDYGANRYGFQPAGDGITVAPPTLVDETTDKTKQNAFEDYDDESVLYARAQLQPQPQPHPQPQPQAIARPLSRQPKRPRPSRPVQFAPQPQPQLQQSHPQFVSYDQAFRSVDHIPVAPTSPAPAPIPIQHVQSFQQQAPVQFQQPSFITYEQPRHITAGARIAAADSPAPTPSRAVVPGSIPSGPLFRPLALPSPVTPAPRPAPVREHPARSSGPSGSVLDTLIQQYALPQGVGQPLHDISFGSYSSQTTF